MSIEIRRTRSVNVGLKLKEPSKSTSALFASSFKVKRISRKYPILAGLHRGIDGGLIGVIFCAALMSSVALHSQYLWTRSFSRLEITRDLNHRLEESIASLERYLLASVIMPKIMVQTKSTDLIYIDSPAKMSHKKLKGSSSNSFPKRYNQLPISHGY